MSFRVRRIRRADAAAYLDLCLRLDGETAFMMYEPGERQTTLAQQEAALDAVLAAPNRMIFVAEAGGGLVGHLQADGGTFRRSARTVQLVVGVLQGFGGRGVASALLAAAEGWAAGAGAHRLELTVMTHNARAVALYQRLGFAVEGTARDALLVDGRYVDEHHMAKLLPA